MGIEPTSRAWEARILPMNYARVVRCADIVPVHSRLCRLSYHFCGGLASFSFPGAYGSVKPSPAFLDRRGRSGGAGIRGRSFFFHLFPVIS